MESESIMIPIILLDEYKPMESDEMNPVRVLEKFCQNWNMDPMYEIKQINNPDEPTQFNATVICGVRHGNSVGGTISEAKALAAIDCIDALNPFLPEGVRPTYSPVVKTDPAKDILYIFGRIVKELNLKKPQYVIHPTWETFRCTCSIGQVKTSGNGRKKRVAIRFAALEMMKQLRIFQLAGKIPSSVYA